MTAARALGLGRTNAYDLARRQQFPCRIIRIGDTYRVPSACWSFSVSLPTSQTERLPEEAEDGAVMPM